MYRDEQWSLLGILHEPRKTLPKYISEWSDLMRITSSKFESDFVYAFQSPAYLVYLSLKMSYYYDEEKSNPFQILFEEYSSSFTRLTESAKILNDSLYLALSGRYASANTLLRPALESITIGVFYTGLLNEENRMDFASSSDDKTFITLVEKALENPECQSDSSYLELTLSNRLREKKRKPPTYKKMLEMIIRWGLLELPENREREELLRVLYEDAYSPLSAVIHTRIDKTYFLADELHSLMPRLLHGEKLIPEKLENFLINYNLVADITGYIYFSAIKPLFQQRKVAQTAIEFLDEFQSQAKELTLTRHLVRKLASTNSRNT